jgi:hypothetical protein
MISSRAITSSIALLQSSWFLFLLLPRFLTVARFNRFEFQHHRAVPQLLS